MVCAVMLLVLTVSLVLNGFSFLLKWIVMKLVGLVRRKKDENA